MKKESQAFPSLPDLHASAPSDVRGEAPTLEQVSDLIAFLESRALESQQQADKETGVGKAFFDGRVMAFELCLTELRDLIAND